MLTPIKNRLTTLEGSVDMAKLVYSYSVSSPTDNVIVTYANADFIVVKLISETGGVPSEGVKIMKGCDGLALIKGNNNTSDFAVIASRVSYDSNGDVNCNFGGKNARV